MTTINYTGTLVTVSCWCGIRHAVPQPLRDVQLRQHDEGETVQVVYCPLGHKHVPSGESRSARLARELDYSRDYAARLAARAEQAKAEARGQKAAKTRARNERDRARTRAAVGVCPCCNRTFKQLAAHMARKHPDYGPVGDA